jgi:DNA-binding CsgD family transcriptional regulator
MHPAGAPGAKGPTPHRPIALSWKSSVCPTSLRDSGISLVGRVPWGTHICLFCATKKDLIEAALAYFQAAPSHNEYCSWLVAEPLRQHEVLKALGYVPALNDWRKKGAFELLDEPPGYSGQGPIDQDEVVDAIHDRIAAARARGFDGVRAFVNAIWRERGIWTDLNAYEQSLDEMIAGQRVIVLCAYTMMQSLADDVLDVARTHQCVIARRKGNWEFLNNPHALEARREIEILNADLDRLPAQMGDEGVLTERERVVLGQIMKGASSKVAGRTLGISHRTVDQHRANAMKKLGVKNTAELVRVMIGGVR